MFAYTFTPNSINMLINGRARTIDSSHINHAKIKSALVSMNTCPDQREQLIEEIKQWVDIPTFIAKITEGRVRISDDAVMFENTRVHNVIAERIIAIMKEGLDVRVMARFLDRLMENPVATARDELYLWLEAGKMPLTDDGCFLAYKRVNANFTSCHDNKTMNAVGTFVEVPRESVDLNRNNTCSSGLHFCSFDYLSSFHGAKIIILKIAPEDVVAIPSDYSNTKGRAWRYEVIGEVPDDEAEKVFGSRSIVSSYGTYDSEFLDELDEEKDEDEPVDSVETQASEPPCECEQCVADRDAAARDELEEEDHRAAMYAPTTLVPSTTDSVVDDELVDYPEDDAVAPPKVSPYTHGGVVYTEAEIIQGLEDHGQRGYSAITGIPRTTLQGWRNKIYNS